MLCTHGRFLTYTHGRFRNQSSSLSLSHAPTAAFASSPARFRFHKQSSLLSLSLASSPGHFRKQPSSLSQAATRPLSPADQLAFAFTGTHGSFRKHPRLLSHKQSSSLSLSQALTVAFASSPARVKSPAGVFQYPKDSVLKIFRTSEQWTSALSPAAAPSASPLCR